MANIFVHHNAKDEAGYKEAVERLEYYGYTIVLYNDFIHPTGDRDFVVDRRSPNWRGWRDILSCFTWRHRDKEVEWQRQKVLDTQPALVYTDESEDCAA